MIFLCRASESREIKVQQTHTIVKITGYIRTHSYVHIHTAAISKEVHLTFVHITFKKKKKKKQLKQTFFAIISVDWNVWVHL